VDELAHKFAGLNDQGIELQVRSPDNRIENVPVTDAHIANVKAAVKALKEKEGKSQSGAAKPTPSPTPK
jgi:hypothetical protein